MAFLTLIAPIVAFTYPLDKLADGKAEGAAGIPHRSPDPHYCVLYYFLHPVGCAAQPGTGTDEFHFKPLRDPQSEFSERQQADFKEKPRNFI